MRRRLALLLAAPERGAVSIVSLVVVVVPAMVLFLALFFFVDRLTAAQSVTAAAADEAARAASIAANAKQAAAEADQVAATMLADQDLACTTTSVETDTSGFAVPAGTAASTTVTVSCDVPLGDLLVPGLPGSHTITATATSVIDTYRERS